MSGSQTFADRYRNVALLLGSFAILIAMMTVLNSRAGGKTEGAVRFLASALGLAAIPILLVLAFRDWRTNQRTRLSPWRSGLGLGSIVVLFAAWLLYWGMFLLFRILPHFSQFLSGLEWLGLVLYSSLLGFILALFLRGAARPQAVSAAFLMWACIQSSVYI